MTSVKIGVQTRSIGQSLRRSLQTAGRVGAEGVQIDLRSELPLSDCSRSAIREIRKLLDDQRLQVASVAYPTRRGYGDPAELDRRVAATQQAMTVAAQLGARVVVNRVGPIPESLLEQTGDTGEADLLIATLTALGLHGERVGARLACATGIDEATLLGALLAKLPEQTIGVDLQPGTIVHQGDSPIETLRQLSPHLLHVTAADAVHDLAQRQVVDVPLGRGTVDVPELLAALDAREYQGWITIQRQGSSDPESELAAAVEYLHTLRQGD